jgi:hypothetical protein
MAAAPFGGNPDFNRAVIRSRSDELQRAAVDLPSKGDSSTFALAYC